LAVDALVITALKLEHDCFKKAASSLNDPKVVWTKMDEREPTPYLAGLATFSDGRTYSMALARPTRMGADSTSVVAANLAAKLKPNCLAMSGVCAGNPKDLALGDIVVAELAYNYEEGKTTTAGLSPDPRHLPIRNSLLRYAQDLDEGEFPSFGTASVDECEQWFLELLAKRVDPNKHPARPRYVADGDWSAFVKRLEKNGDVANNGTIFKITTTGKKRLATISLYNVASPKTLPFKIHAGPMASGASVNKTGVVWICSKSEACEAR
jgi:nucleoside phosphorylase